MTPRAPDDRSTSSLSPRVGFIIESVLGHATHARNLARLVPEVPGVRPEFRPLPFTVEGWDRHVPAYRSNWTVRSGLRMRRAVRALRRSEPLDGLFVHTQTPAVMSPDWLRRIPTVVSIDATPAQYDQLGLHYDHAVGRPFVESLKWRANAACFRNARHLVTWSAWARSGLAQDYGIDPAGVTVIAPGVDLSTWRRPIERDVGDGTVRVLFVGGDLVRKGGLVLIDAVRRLRADALPVELHLVTGAEVATGDGIVVHRGLGPNDARLVELYHRADVFCLPTAGDCLPMVLAEAGAAGLPLVSTPVGAIPEIVRPGETGELVPPGDVDALAAVLLELVGDTELRRRFGRGAEALVLAHHDAAANAAALVGVLRTAAGWPP